MSKANYIRHTTSGAAILCDRSVVEAFNQKKTLNDEIDALRADINTMKQQIADLQSQLNAIHKSE